MNEANEAAQPKEQVVLKISITVDGLIKVAGPIVADKAGAYSMLEMAKDAVRELHAPKQPIIRPQGNMLDMLRRNGKH